MIKHRKVSKYYETDCTFNGVCPRDSLTIKNDMVYLINLDEYAEIGTHCISLYVEDIEIIYFESLSVGHVPKGIEKFIEHINIKINIFRI